MNKTKIEWCDSTWNPVTGCLHECKYCYARRIANRFKPTHLLQDCIGHELIKPISEICKDGKTRLCVYPYGFEPTFHRYRLEEPKRWKKPRTIFVCSMSDLFGDWVPDSWIKEVFSACQKAPQHNYFFLTKNVRRYAELGKLLPADDNMWYGISITKESEVHNFNSLPAFRNTFVSIEPLLEELCVEQHNILFRQVDWVIIGAETGNRKGKVIPEKEWVDNICAAADIAQTAVFMKDSLLPIMGEENMRRQFPWEESCEKK